MMLWLLLLTALLLGGFLLLHITCARRDKPDGWEDERIARCGDEARQKAWKDAEDWLERHEAEDVEVQSDDGFVLHALLVPNITARATVILFHGWHSSAAMDFLCILPFLHAQGLQCLLVDERAQGDSEGQYTTLGVRERADVPVWVDYAANRFGAEHPIFLHGLSMGASVVLMASANRFGGNVRGIVADCGFTSPYEIASSVWRSKTHLPARAAMWVLDKYARLFADFSLKECSAVDALRETAYPVLFIHGTADRFVPSAMTEQMYEACGSEKTLVLVEGAGHCMSYLTDRARYEAAYKEFVDKHLEEK